MADSLSKSKHRSNGLRAHICRCKAQLNTWGQYNLEQIPSQNRQSCLSQCWQPQCTKLTQTASWRWEGPRQAAAAAPGGTCCRAPSGCGLLWVLTPRGAGAPARSRNPLNCLQAWAAHFSTIVQIQAQGPLAALYCCNAWLIEEHLETADSE